MTHNLRQQPGSLRADLHRLEHVLATSTAPLADLRAVASPERLHVLFYLHLCALVRAGPSPSAASLSPPRLLALAQQAAGSGLLPLATPGVLRRLLRRLESLVRDAGAWAGDQPLWWHPLPAPDSFEALWDGLTQPDGAWCNVPEPASVAAAFGSVPEAPRWLSMPALLTPAFTRLLHGSLEAAYQDGRLPLEREGVGATGRLSARRADEVCYLTGLEPDVLMAVPALAALVQWGLHVFCAWLSTAYPGQNLHPPQRAMLARYPAPSEGFHPHVDNPGGPHGNGRTITAVLYLNAPEAECAGGSLAVWGADASPASPPTQTTPSSAGSAMVFDARTIAHQVMPLDPGPARWALTMWLNDTPQRPSLDLALPTPTLTDVLLPLTAPPLPPGTVLFHEVSDQHPGGEIVVRARGTGRPRVGVVSTVYRGRHALDAWCAHHLALGFDHLLLIFDHLDEPDEAADATRLAAAYPSDRLTIWSGTTVASERWPAVLRHDALKPLPAYARSGSSSSAVSARQTLNASAALEAARHDELGGQPLDWLLHLDADELFYLEGAGRGGATLHEHFAAASAACLHRIRYINHELLLPRTASTALRFKRNPRLAQARLGIHGWAALVEHLAMAPTDPRPYFSGYHNGKSAVAVPFGVAAAGVHSWALADSSGSSSRFVAGPSILHFRYASPEAFRQKYSLIAAAAEEPPLFDLAPAEEAAVALIAALQEAGADDATLKQRLDGLHATLTTFSDRDADLLSEAGLLVEPRLDHALPV